MNKQEFPVWYAMRATYRRELDAKQLLDKASIGCFVPMHYRICVKGKQKKREFVPVIHNLIFVYAKPSEIQRVKKDIPYLQYMMDSREGTKIVVPDDQMRRFVDGMQELGLYDNTVFVITSDHGDYVGEYGLMKKGAGVPDAITRVPMVWFGNGVEASGRRDDHVCLTDIFPTACEVMGAEIPLGVQGRSLTEMLGGREYPEDEFRSVMSEAGFGGEYFTAEDSQEYVKEGAVGKKGLFFDELNTWSQSGTICMVRMGDW